MTTQVADVLLHIDATLPPDQLKTLERHLYEMGGVIKAFNREDRPHLIQPMRDSHDAVAEVMRDHF